MAIIPPPQSEASEAAFYLVLRAWHSFNVAMVTKQRPWIKLNKLQTFTLGLSEK